MVLPAAHDAITAALIERAGFRICFMSGFAVSATQIASPDMGLISYGEMLDCGRRICEAAGSVCVVGDGDTGYGNAGNIRRTIEGYARAGFAGITIEDQCYPKRCSYARGVVVVSRAHAVARVAAAVAARDEMRAATGLDLVIVARTDCRNASSIESEGEAGAGADDRMMAEALERCAAFERLGADVVYAENLQDKEEYAELSLKVSSTHLMLAQLQRGDAPSLSPDDVANLGFDLSLVGVTALQAYIATLQSTANSLLATGAASNLASFGEVKRVVGFDELLDFEARYACD